MGRLRSFNEDEVLRAARDHFWDAGYEGTSTYDLMHVMGLGKGSIYKAFGNKHDLYMRVFSDYCQDLVSQAQQALTADTASPRRRLEEYLISLAHLFSSESPRRGCFLTNATTDRAGKDPAVAEQSKRAFDGIAAEIASALRAAQVAGEVDPEASATEWGYLLLSVIRGIDTLARAGVEEPVLTNTARAALEMLPARRTETPC
ncbi:TetR/AcrR family transcriptional regulator [Streptomyces sp. NPDC051954]|uniref:TetR/AcrR family transcriptional regulator n=1 Tax=unclassified Streptomyces TaxID=2593676 RepID=UPI00341958B9